MRASNMWEAFGIMYSMVREFKRASHFSSWDSSKMVFVRWGPCGGRNKPIRSLPILGSLTKRENLLVKVHILLLKENFRTLLEPIKGTSKMGLSKASEYTGLKPKSDTRDITKMMLSTVEEASSISTILLPFVESSYKACLTGKGMRQTRRERNIHCSGTMVFMLT